MRRSRKFIAGAACPACGQVDKIYTEDGTQTWRCVNCGHDETQEEKERAIDEPDIIVKSSLQKD